MIPSDSSAALLHRPPILPQTAEGSVQHGDCKTSPKPASWCNCCCEDDSDDSTYTPPPGSSKPIGEEDSSSAGYPSGPPINETMKRFCSETPVSASLAELNGGRENPGSESERAESTIGSPREAALKGRHNGAPSQGMTRVESSSSLASSQRSGRSGGAGVEVDPNTPKKEVDDY